jgi:hypothetical protein
MLRDASQRAAVAERFARELRCDAPEHEGGRRDAYRCNVIRSSQHRHMQHVSILARRFGFDCRNRGEAL